MLYVCSTIVCSSPCMSCRAWSTGVLPEHRHTSEPGPSQLQEFRRLIFGLPEAPLSIPPAPSRNETNHLTPGCRQHLLNALREDRPSFLTPIQTESIPSPSPVFRRPPRRQTMRTPRLISCLSIWRGGSARLTAGPFATTRKVRRALHSNGRGSRSSGSQ
jgi:hypothetical protein